MDPLKDFKEYIKKEGLFQPKDKLLLAVSGGVDSVVLCELCHQANILFAIAHCNFQLRGAESERDEQFVTAMAKKYAAELFLNRFDTEKYATENKTSIQVAARELRYAWFNNLAIENNFDRVVTAHHADDNMETLLMNFFKGTGINGMKGILPKQGNLVRPLLFANKNTITEFATASGLDFVEDSSNASDKYTRNYFRNQIIPLLQQVFPMVTDNLKDNLNRFREIEIIYNESINQHKKSLQVQKGEEVHISVMKLQKAIPLRTIVYEIIKAYNFSAHQVNEVIGLLKSDSGKYVSSQTHRILKNRNWLIISLLKSDTAQHILITEEDKSIVFEQGNVHIKQCHSHHINSSPLIAQLNLVEITFPLLLRKWKQGDYFYPLGMQKQKKLSRFFIDQKLSLDQKEKVWVIEMNNKIVWVVGMRIDNRFKITSQTSKILEISLTPAK